MGKYRIDTIAKLPSEIVPEIEDFLNELHGLGWEVMSVEYRGLTPMGRESYMVISRRPARRWWQRK